MQSTAEMIFPDKAIAASVMGLLKKRKGGEWEIEKVVTGFKVRSLAPAPQLKVVMGLDLAKDGSLSQTVIAIKKAAEPLQVVENTSSFLAESGLVASKKANTEQTVYVALTYRKQSPQFLEVEHNGKVTWVQKSCVEASEVDHAALKVMLKMPQSYAKKRGFAFTFKP